MDKKLKELHKIYDHIEIPKELDSVIDDAIKKNNKNRDLIKRRQNNMARSIMFKRVGAIAATLVIGMGITVNISPVLAQELSEVPLIGAVAKMMTIREYETETDTSKSDVKVPSVELEDQGIQDKINKIINDKIADLEAEQAKLDAEYKEAYLETGGKEENYNKIEMIIDYKLNYSTDKIISFSISKAQTLAPAYSETVYYNIDINTGETFNLEDVLGENYGNLVKSEVVDQMNKSEDIEYDIDYLKNNIEIDNERKFYINDKNEIVVVFDKYEVAAGVHGAQEFVISSMK